MATFKNGQWLVGSKTSIDKWLSVNAKTLMGAKRCATKTFQCTVGGVIQVAYVEGSGDNAQVVEMSRKHGYDNWVDAP